MIIRLAHKLARQIKAAPTALLPMDSDPYADWSGHSFAVGPSQYILFSNTASLYSAICHARGLTDDTQFVECSLGALRDFMIDDGQEFTFLRLIAPTSASVRFSKALNRSITGSMNDLVSHAQMWMSEDGLSPQEIAAQLNEMPMAALNHVTPRDAFKALGAAVPEEGRG